MRERHLGRVSSSSIFAQDQLRRIRRITRRTLPRNATPRLGAVSGLPRRIRIRSPGDHFRDPLDPALSRIIRLVDWQKSDSYSPDNDAVLTVMIRKSSNSSCPRITSSPEVILSLVPGKRRWTRPIAQRAHCRRFITCDSPCAKLCFCSVQSISECVGQRFAISARYPQGMYLHWSAAQDTVVSSMVSPQGGSKGNPVRIRNCPAAVSRYESPR